MILGIKMHLPNAYERYSGDPSGMRQIADNLRVSLHYFGLPDNR